MLRFFFVYFFWMVFHCREIDLLLSWERLTGLLIPDKGKLTLTNFCWRWHHVFWMGLSIYYFDCFEMIAGKWSFKKCNYLVLPSVLCGMRLLWLLLFFFEGEVIYYSSVNSDSFTKFYSNFTKVNGFLRTFFVVKLSF